MLQLPASVPASAIPANDVQSSQDKNSDDNSVEGISPVMIIVWLEIG